MTRRDKLLQVLAQDVYDDCADYEQLLPLMQALYGLLLRRDTAQIEQINGRISQHLEVLAARSERRSKVLAAFSLAPGAESMQRLFAQYALPERARLAAAWQQLGSLATQCQAQNQDNGQLLAMHNDILCQLLAANQADPLYQPRHY